MNGTYLLIGIFIIFMGVYWYNSLSMELAVETYSLSFNISKMSHLASMQNYALALSATGFLVGLGGALERNPPQT